MILNFIKCLVYLRMDFYLLTIMILFSAYSSRPAELKIRWAFQEVCIQLYPFLSYVWPK